MDAPNRARVIVEIFDRLGLPKVAKTEADTGRRANLFRIVVELNLIDGGQWGVLQKTEQGNKIPGDVIVWRDTLEHFDVILGDGGPSWKPWGPVHDDRWHWLAVDGSVKPSEPGGEGETGGVLDQNLDAHMIPGSAGRALLDMNARSAIVDAAEVRTHIDGQHGDVLAAIKGIPTPAPGPSKADLAGVAVAAGAIVTRSAAAERAHGDAQHREVMTALQAGPATPVTTPIGPVTFSGTVLGRPIVLTAAAAAADGGPAQLVGTFLGEPIVLTQDPPA